MNEKQFQKLKEEDPELAEHFHFVRAGGGNRAYWRRIPKTYRDKRARPASQLRVQVALGEAAQKARGKRGFAEDGTPIVADEIRKKMKGKSFKRPAWKRAIEALRESLREVAEVIQET